jgi:2-succinyl-6-hydroxy-2,4-cyclohexadiene-1-carboxylate synthase
MKNKDVNYYVDKSFYKDEKCPVVFLHGFTGSSEIWNTIRENISRESIAIDLPGHGNSGISQMQNSNGFSFINDHLREIFDSLGLKKVILCGYSMGGRIALNFVKQHASFVEKLILEGAHPGLKTDQEKLFRQAIDYNVKQEILDDYDSFLARWEQLALFRKHEERNPDAFNNLQKIRRNNDKEKIVYSLQHFSLAQQSYNWDVLQNVSFPTLYLAGEEDEKYTKIGLKLQNLSSNVVTKIVPDSGHTVHVEQEDLYIQAIEGFIEGNK